jgi:hypothetical protein
MRCKIFSKLEHEKKQLLVLELHSLSRHIGKRKMKVTTKGVQACKFFYLKDS